MKSEFIRVQIMKINVFWYVTPQTTGLNLFPAECSAITFRIQNVGKFKPIARRQNPEDAKL